MSGGVPGAVASPCIGVCRIDAASGWCEGCLRTLDEIAVWSVLDDGEKRAVVEGLAPRRQALASAGSGAVVAREGDGGDRDAPLRADEDRPR